MRQKVAGFYLRLFLLTFYSKYLYNYYKTKKAKVMFRSRNRILGGVCAGLAKSIGIDPLIIRIIWGVLVFIYGVGILLYLLLWIIVPEE